MSADSPTPRDVPRVDPLVSSVLDLAASVRALVAEIREERGVTTGRLDGIASGVGELAKEVGDLAAKVEEFGGSEEKLRHRLAVVETLTEEAGLGQRANGHRST